MKIYMIFLRYLDTSLIDVDVQPTHVRVTIKSKVRWCRIEILSGASFLYRDHSHPKQMLMH